MSLAANIIDPASDNTNISFLLIFRIEKKKIDSRFIQLWQDSSHGFPLHCCAPGVELQEATSLAGFSSPHLSHIMWHNATDRRLLAFLQVPSQQVLYKRKCYYSYDDEKKLIRQENAQQHPKIIFFFSYKQIRVYLQICVHSKDRIEPCTAGMRDQNQNAFFFGHHKKRESKRLSATAE